MLVFIIPIKSKTVSSSWERVCELFESCLRSVCNQTVSDFKVIVVCHERPDVEFTHPAISYVEVDYSLIPTETGNTQLRYKRHDKCRKIWAGLRAAKAYEPSHVMFVDADDLVSNRLAEYVLRHPESSGWYADTGYEYQLGSDRVFLRKTGFHQLSGTSNIVKYSLLQPETALPFESVGWRFLWHQNIVEIMKERQQPLSPLSFPGAIYTVDNGENLWSQTSLRMGKGNLAQKMALGLRSQIKRTLAKPITPDIRKEFNMNYG